MEDANILTKIYDFIKALIPLVNTFPHDQSYILGYHLARKSNNLDTIAWTDPSGVTS